LDAGFDSFGGNRIRPATPMLPPIVPERIGRAIIRRDAAMYPEM
jgi:hypothetical protein